MSFTSRFRLFVSLTSFFGSADDRDSGLFVKSPSLGFFLRLITVLNLFTLDVSLSQFPSTLDISSGLEELFEKVVQLRPLLVCFKGLTKLTDAVLHRLNEYGRDGHPEYVDLRRTDVKNGWIPFKMEQDDGSTTYFCSVCRPSSLRRSSRLIPS